MLHPLTGCPVELSGRPCVREKMTPSELPCLGTVLRDVLAMPDPAVAVLSVRRQRQLQPFWPEIRFLAGTPHSSVLAARQAWPRRTGVSFGPGLLRAPAGQPGTSTILATFRRGAAAGSLGTRLLDHPASRAALDRGARFAAAVVSHRLGGSRAGTALPAGMRLLVSSGIDAADQRALAALLRSGPAATLAVLGASAKLRGAVAETGGRVVTAADPWAVIDAAAEIHAPADSPIALLARLAGHTVFHGGEALPATEPGLLAAAHLLLGTRYLDPADGRPITPEAFLDRAIAWQRLRRTLPNIACVAGISFWKKRRIADFLGAEPVHARNAAAAVSAARRGGGGIAVWPSRAPQGLDAAAAAAGIPVFRIEDGFIRSRGLGADFIPPASVIIDGRGVYYDTRSPSDLEHLLQTADFPADLLARAHRLRHELVRRGITKYNVGAPMAALPSPPGRRRILVPGQVANDKSVLAGGGGLSPGLPLLQRVRAAHPDAFIVYKPHPDVEAGHRPGAVTDTQALRFADRVVRDAPMGSLIEAVDEIHTLTSLAGFEALLRGRRVVTYGTPFYAGWGLTTDLHPPGRPRRPLTLDALVAATLILYPFYLDPVSRLPCEPEALMERLDGEPPHNLGLLVMARRLQGALRRRFARPAAEVA